MRTKQLRVGARGEVAAQTVADVLPTVRERDAAAHEAALDRGKRRTRRFATILLDVHLSTPPDTKAGGRGSVTGFA
jgi:hypothetical protein